MENNQRNDGSDNGNHNNGLGGNHNHSQILIVVIVTLITLLIMSFFNNMLTKSSTSEEISYSQFLEMVDNGEVAQVIMSSDKLTIIPKNQPNAVYGIQRTYYTGRISNDPYLVSRLEKAEVEFSEEIPDTTTGQIISILLSFAPLILIWVVLGMVMRRMSSGGGMMGVGKSRAKVYVQKETGVLFKDVAGNIQRSALNCRKARCWWDRPEQVRLCWRKRWQGKRNARSTPCPVPILWRCSWA